MLRKKYSLKNPMKTNIFISPLSILIESLTATLPNNLHMPLMVSLTYSDRFFYLILFSVAWLSVVLWLCYQYRKAEFLHWILSFCSHVQSKSAMSLTSSPVYSSNLVSRDEIDQMTPVSKLHQELKMANQDIEIFLYKAYHNFLGPIATIRGICNVALLDGQEDEAPQYFTQVNKVAESMQAMLEKLLEVSEIHNQNINLAQVNLNSLLRDYQSNQSEDQEVRARFHMDIPTTIQVCADSFLLTTAIEKIITSAHRFRYNRPHAVAEIFIKHQQSPDCDIIHLKEYGLKLPSDTLDNLFKMFHRSSTKPDDHGLGFYAARYAIRRMGGDIAIESGAGYITFCIQLPKQTVHSQEN